jgi:hypothetical protein
MHPYDAVGVQMAFEPKLRHRRVVGLALPEITLAFLSPGTVTVVVAVFIVLVILSNRHFPKEAPHQLNTDRLRRAHMMVVDGNRAIRSLARSITIATVIKERALVSTCWKAVAICSALGCECTAMVSVKRVRSSTATRAPEKA